jgi:hypothetical protein
MMGYADKLERAKHVGVTILSKPFQYRRLAGAAAERETVAAGGCIALRSPVMECCARNHMATGSEYGL